MTRLDSIKIEELVADLEGQISALMKRKHVEGLSVTVIRDGRIAWAREFGVRDVRTGDAVSPDTVFEGASFNKPAAAYVALKMCEFGASSGMVARSFSMLPGAKGKTLRVRARISSHSWRTDLPQISTPREGETGLPRRSLGVDGSRSSSYVEDFALPERLIGVVKMGCQNVKLFLSVP